MNESFDSDVVSNSNKCSKGMTRNKKGSECRTNTIGSGWMQLWIMMNECSDAVHRLSLTVESDNGSRFRLDDR